MSGRYPWLQTKLDWGVPYPSPFDHDPADCHSPEESQSETSEDRMSRLIHELDELFAEEDAKKAAKKANTFEDERNRTPSSSVKSEVSVGDLSQLIDELDDILCDDYEKKADKKDVRKPAKKPVTKEDKKGDKKESKMDNSLFEKKKQKYEVTETAMKTDERQERRRRKRELDELFADDEKKAGKKANKKESGEADKKPDKKVNTFKDERNRTPSSSVKSEASVGNLSQLIDELDDILCDDYEKKADKKEVRKPVKKEDTKENKMANRMAEKKEQKYEDTETSMKTDEREERRRRKKKERRRHQMEEKRRENMKEKMEDKSAEERRLKREEKRRRRSETERAENREDRMEDRRADTREAKSAEERRLKREERRRHKLEKRTENKEDRMEDRRTDIENWKAERKADNMEEKRTEILQKKSAVKRTKDMEDRGTDNVTEGSEKRDDFLTKKKEEKLGDMAGPSSRDSFNAKRFPWLQTKVDWGDPLFSPFNMDPADYQEDEDTKSLRGRRSPKRIPSEDEISIFLWQLDDLIDGDVFVKKQKKQETRRLTPEGARPVTRCTYIIPTDRQSTQDKEQSLSSTRETNRISSPCSSISSYESSTGSHDRIKRPSIQGTTSKRSRQDIYVKRPEPTSGIQPMVAVHTGSENTTKHTGLGRRLRQFFHRIFRPFRGCLGGPRRKKQHHN